MELNALNYHQKAVALLAEGVDRNMLKPPIEMIVYPVALLAEGVDRNKEPVPPPNCFSVALLAEGVDRNRPLPHGIQGARGRPPRGGRG